MVTPLSQAVRQKIITFDPANPDAVKVSEFCTSLKISRRSFYTIRQRYAEESRAALHPRSSAPHRTQRVYDDSVTRVLLAARADLKSRGWDYGPMSIRFEIAVEHLVEPPIPSVSTIARLLRAAGAVEANPKKRPKSSYVGFQRSQTMALRQIDAFEYKLFDDHTSKVTIYQVLDDATRKDMGTTAFADPENADDAMTVMQACITAYGAPHEVLSENHSSFNQLGQGRVGAMELYLASVGSLAISGRTYHPQTQGKNERSHQTLYRFLQAHQPTSLEEVNALLVSYRQHYNHLRPHQSLPPNMTPQVITITGQNRAVFFQGWKIALPKNYAERQLYRTVADGQLAYWCVGEGDMVLSVPLPIVAITGPKKFVNSYNIQGVWLKDPPHCGPNAANRPSRNSRPSLLKAALDPKW